MTGPDTVIIGAGIAGLSCARELVHSGHRPLLLDRGRGVGGRCATRRVEGQPVDHGVAFLHGSELAFLEALEGVRGATAIPGWPARVEGKGTPCQPEAFRPGQTCLAFREGVSAFPKHLATGLEVRLETRVTRLTPEEGGWIVGTEAGPVRARDVVLALAAEQIAGMLEPLTAEIPEAASAHALLGMVGSVPCLTMLAGYSPGQGEPDWDLCHPQGAALQLISHDSSKRSKPRYRVLVAQARPAWSRENLDRPQEEWGRLLVEETAALVGPWVTEPAWVQLHRWRYARVERGMEFAGPLLLRGPDSGRLGLAGDLFARGGGVQAAWLSGRRLAHRLLEED